MLAPGLAQITHLLTEENINNIDIVDHILRIGVKECEKYLTVIPKQTLQINMSNADKSIFLWNKFYLYYLLHTPQKINELRQIWTNVNSIIKSNKPFDINIINDISKDMYQNNYDFREFDIYNLLSDSYIKCNELYLENKYLDISLQIILNPNVLYPSNLTFLNRINRTRKTDQIDIIKKIIKDMFNHKEINITEIIKYL